MSANRESEGVVERFAAGRLARRVGELGPALERAREVLRFAARRGSQVRLGQVAGGLTFTTVLGVVPLLVVALAVFTAFPLFGEFRVSLEKLLLKNLLPDPFSAVILRNLNDFATQAARLGAAGFAFLLATALAMALTVDRVLNDIWNVRQRRPLAQRLLVYWALLTLGPVLAGGSLTLTSWLASMSAGLVQQIPLTTHQVLDWVPVLVSGLTWSALFVYVPNRRVLWRDALVGGYIAAVLGEGFSRGFASYITKGLVTTIYGAFAVVPVFLAWIYISWFTVLFGAAIAATLPMLRATRFADQHRAGNAFITAAALLLELLARRRREPPGEAGAAALAGAVHTFEDEALQALQTLESLGYVREVSAPGSDGEGRWIAVCDPQHATLAPLFRRMAIDPDLSLLRGGDGLGGWLRAALESDWLATPLARLMPAEPPARPPSCPEASA